MTERRKGENKNKYYPYFFSERKQSRAFPYINKNVADVNNIDVINKDCLKICWGCK